MPNKVILVVECRTYRHVVGFDTVTVHIGRLDHTCDHYAFHFLRVHNENRVDGPL